MTRKDFLKMCGILGISMPFQSSMLSCNNDDTVQPTFKGKVIIVGAGVGGLSTGYLLQQLGIDFEILEASAFHGGRVRINADFADFPIPLGAEWIETSTSIFQEIVHDPTVQINIETIPDSPDRKFVDYSWYNFFDEFIVPSIKPKISYNTIVQSIDYSGEKITVNTQNSQYTADKVVVSVPLKVLQDGDINFQPALPGEKLDAINNSTIWAGFKAFFEFSQKFYSDDEYAFNISPASNGQKIYYNAALGQNTSKNILGLFVVGKPALDYAALSGNQLKDYILSELDGIYSNQATPNYIKHIYQNWNNEPFIKSGYLSDYADWKAVKTLGKSVMDKIYFAGGEYTDGNDWVSVHAAARAARSAVDALKTQ